MVQKAMNEAYTEYRFKKNIPLVRYALLAFLLLYGITFFYDSVNIVPLLPVYVILRFWFVLPLGALLFGLTFWSDFWRYYQLTASIFYLLVLYSICVYILFDPTALFYYFLFVIVFIWGITLLDLAVPYLMLCNIIFLMVLALFSFLFIADQFSDIYQYIFYYMIVLSFLMVSKFRTEHQLRMDYQTYEELQEKSFNLEDEIAGAIAQVAETQKVTIEALASLAESKDKTTGDHVGRVGYLCGMVARELPVSYYYEARYTKEEFALTIELASLLHDIGKIGVDPLILSKPGPLTVDERKVMETHTTIGHETLHRIQKKFPKNPLIDMGAEITRHHHENWDGSGYPDHLEKHKIPLSARIVAIIDVYDALMSKRPYKEAFSFHESIEIMRSLKYTKFDPKLLDYFIDVIHRKDVQKRLGTFSN